MKDGGRAGSAGMRARRWTTALIVAELTLTLVLLSGAGLMMRSFMNLYRMDIGVDTSRLVSMQLMFPTRTYASLESRALFLQRLDDRLNGITRHRGSELDELPAVQRRVAAAVRDRRTGGHDGRAAAARRHGGGRLQILRCARGAHAPRPRVHGHGRRARARSDDHQSAARRHALPR